MVQLLLVRFEGKMDVDMSFQLWSESNADAKKELLPELGLRKWADISSDEKYLIWQHLLPYFFNKEPERISGYKGRVDYAYEFTGNLNIRRRKEQRIENSITALSNSFKARNYAPKFLEKQSLFNACADFYEIFRTQTENVAIELISLYARQISEEDPYLELKPGETPDEYNTRKQSVNWVEFDKFSDDFNLVFSEFGLNYLLTRLGFVPRIDKKIVENVYVPVLKALSNIQWKEVNALLTESFNEYRKNTPESYSTCVTKAVTAVQAFLQILVNGETGTGDISKLIPEALRKSLIPDDNFSSLIFKDIQSTLMRERRETSDAHPRREFANEKNARLVLNLAMVFFQHCLA